MRSPSHVRFTVCPQFSPLRRFWTACVGGLEVSALFLLATHDAWIEHPTWDPTELALIDVCDLCELSESIPGGASFDEPGRVLASGLAWDAPPLLYVFSPVQRISAEPSSPRAPPAHLA